MSFKAYVKNYYDIQAMQPAAHVMAHSAPFAGPVPMGYDPAGKDWTYLYFSTCEITFGGAALLANHKDADHVFYILDGYGYSLMDGKRYTFETGDIMWTPGNTDHEMYPFGTATLKFLVTLCPQGFKASEPYIKNINDVEPATEPGNDGVTFFTLASPTISGSPTQEFHIVDVLPGAKLSLDTPKSDVIAYMFQAQAEATVDGEKLAMKKAEDTLVVPMGAKWDIANTTKQTLRLALSLSPSR
ncbi:MAG: cupin domain-containing protein [Clostridiales Family XIII bacterium]|jgi:mannose-6-phosphate isomerase-like protein (cupin superfamily)|nr:cupin domain-containing protein [Clostridiales Family XIII bacterium]